MKIEFFNNIIRLQKYLKGKDEHEVCSIGVFKDQMFVVLNEPRIVNIKEEGIDVPYRLSPPTTE